MRYCNLIWIALALLSAARSSPDEFSQCVKRCTEARDPLSGGECVRLCEQMLDEGQRAGDEMTEGSE